MTLEEFVEKYNGMPWDYEAFARAALEEISVGCELNDAAGDYVNAASRFEEALDAAGIEMG